MRSVLRRPLWAAGAAATASVMVCAMAVTPANAAPHNNSSAKLRKAVTLEGITRHLEAFQDIADANEGNRFAGLPGYDQSVDYVVKKLKRAGYEPTVQEFNYFAFFENSPAELSFGGESPVLDEDFATMSYSGSGTVTAAVSGPSGANTGCDPTDYTDFPAGEIAVVSRGVCSFRIKADAALAGGASAVIVYNNVDELLNGTLGEGGLAAAPVVGTTPALGEQLLGFAGEVTVTTDTDGGELTTRNVLAELPGRSGDENVVMVGAHLDSVAEGPGINDNGTGSAGILETALQLAKTKPANTVRFAWWSAEESGLVGSNYYVDQLTEEERAKIALYLNFDMIGSPNYARFVYDGDNGAFPVGTGSAEAPEGSAQIEELFEDYFASQRLASEPTAFSGRSDYGRFIFFGIPAGGLFTGAEGIKTPEQAVKFGGEAGVAYDECYHLACDDIDNVNLTGLDEMSDAVAHAVITYAMSTESVNGVKSPGKGDGKGQGHGKGHGDDKRHGNGHGDDKRHGKDHGKGHRDHGKGKHPAVGTTTDGAGTGSGGGLHEDHDHAELAAA